MGKNKDMPDVIYLTLDETKDFDPCGLPAPSDTSKYIRADSLYRVRDALNFYANLHWCDHVNPYKTWYEDGGSRSREALSILDDLGVK